MSHETPHYPRSIANETSLVVAVPARTPTATGPAATAQRVVTLTPVTASVTLVPRRVAVSPSCPALMLAAFGVGQVQAGSPNG